MTEFYKDMVNDYDRLSGIAVKIYIIFRSMEKEGDGEFYWVSCSYTALLEKVKIKYKDSIKKGLLELAENGWIKDYIKSHYDKKEKRRVSNQYCISKKRISKPDINLYLKMTNVKRDE